MNFTEFIELPATIRPFSIDKPVIGINLGAENHWAGQFVKKDGRSFVQILKIGGGEKYSLWNGIVFDGRIIHLGEAAKLHIALKMNKKEPINGAYRLKEFYGISFDKVQRSSVPFPIVKDQFNRIAIPVKENGQTDAVSLKIINSIFIKSIISDLENVYGIRNPHIVVTQPDHADITDIVLQYGVLKVKNVNIDRLIFDSQAAILAYGVEISEHAYIVFNFGKTDFFISLIYNGTQVAAMKSNICGILVEKLSQQTTKAAKTKLKEIQDSIEKIFLNLIGQVNGSIDGIILAGNAQDLPLAKQAVKNSCKEIPVLDSINPELVFVVGATIFAAEKLQSEMESDRPLNGLFQELFGIGVSSSSNGYFLNPLPAPPSYDSVINTSSSSTDAPPPWTPSTISMNETIRRNSTTEIYRF